MIVLGIVELARRADFGGDRSPAGSRQTGLVGLSRSFCNQLLPVVEGIYPRPVLGAGVVALSHALRRIVGLPEQLQQTIVICHLRIKNHQHDFVVPGLA